MSAAGPEPEADPIPSVEADPIPSVEADAETAPQGDADARVDADPRAETDPQVDADAPVGRPSAEGPDPRRARRPGLPSGRREGDDHPRPEVVPAAIDEAILGLAHRIVELAADKKAADIVLLDVRRQTTMTDYFVICSGASDRQLNAIADGIIEGAKEGGDAPLSREGDAGSHWLLIDFGGVIVHVMSPPEREFYQLEKLWKDASLLLHIV